MTLRVGVEVGRPEEKPGAVAIPFVQVGERVEPALRLSERLARAVENVGGREFKGKLEEVYPLPLGKASTPERLLLIGLGKRGELGLEEVRRGYGRAALKAEEMGLESLRAVLPSGPMALAEAAGAAAEGALLASYRYDRYKSERREPALKELRILVEERSAEVEEAVERAGKLYLGVKAARDIANTPASDCTPERFEELARRELEGLPVSVKVYRARELEEMGMGGILNVGRGSAHEPRLIVLEYGDPSKELYVVAGKAVTFDSGGISIKPPERMEEMKYDKAGGAAVVGVLKAAALLKLPVRLVGLIPVVENMPSGAAYKPGDVVRFRNGKTAEIITTDAEGRLILADALAYGAELKPKAMIDLATLTGACVIALGTHASGLFTNSQELGEKLRESGERTGERVWQLPLWKPYYDQLKSDVADMKNVGGRPAGAITAAAFLSNFVGETPWAHLDIAGTAWIQETSEQKSYTPKGATGIGVRLIIDYLTRETR